MAGSNINTELGKNKLKNTLETGYQPSNPILMKVGKIDNTVNGKTERATTYKSNSFFNNFAFNQPKENRSPSKYPLFGHYFFTAHRSCSTMQPCYVQFHFYHLFTTFWEISFKQLKGLVQKQRQ